MSVEIVVLPEPEVLMERLTDEFWRRKYRKMESYRGSYESMKIIEQYHKSLEKEEED